MHVTLTDCCFFAVLLFTTMGVKYSFSRISIIRSWACAVSDGNSYIYIILMLLFTCKVLKIKVIGIHFKCVHVGLFGSLR